MTKKHPVSYWDHLLESFQKDSAYSWGNANITLGYYLKRQKAHMKQNHKFDKTNPEHAQKLLKELAKPL